MEIVQCEAIARSTGRRCGRMAPADSALCRLHQGPAGSGPGRKAGNRSFYADALEEEVLGLEVAAALKGVGDEIAVLRVLIRKVAREGDLEATRRGVETLCRALKVQYALEGRSAEGLAGSLARVLDEVGTELGMVL